MMKFLSTIFFSFLLLSAVGCSGKIKANGTVKFPDGTPIERGSVYIGNGLTMYKGQIGKGGYFKLGGIRDGDGIPVGNYQIWLLVNTSDTVVDAKGRETVVWDYVIDPKFENPETSGLTFEAKKDGPRTIDIVVEKPAPGIRKK